MHRCLLIPEIVHLVCDEIGDRHWKNTQRDTSLFALAQTCRYFREPALAVLWEFIPDLGPLIRCAGRDIWTLQHKGSELRLTRRISQSHIAIMKRYARLVREFGTTYARSAPTVAPYVWTKLQSLLGDTILFPNVRSLHFADPHTMQFLSLFFTQGLTSFALTLPAISKKRAPFWTSRLVDLSSRCPNLESVNLHDFSEPEEQEGVISALSNWHNLSEAILFPATLPALQVLSQYSSASLQRLVFSDIVPFTGILPMNLPPAAVDRLDFAALQTLSIGFRNFTMAISFIDDFHVHGGLQKLSISIHNLEPTQESDYLGLLRSVKKHSSSLKELDVEERFLFATDDHRAVPLSNTLISSLATDFRTLTCVSISHVGGYDVVDEDLKNLSEALPLLEDFWLVDDTSPLGIRFKTTVASLVYFVLNCPHLISLYLVFDARADKIYPARQLLGSPFKASQLDRLEVSISPVDDPPLLARLLFDLFPDIELLFWDETLAEILDDPTPYPWLEVQEILHQHQKGNSSRVQVVRLMN